ncbi:MAG: Uncharacterized protein XD97_0322 [Pelotomaculum thermopropionicum]|uniref:UPF0122 protein XD97_0322 n=1 Tax=Pelotomaculum thermopropionicum TaxID=110500 RepID=A0A101HTM0_9FIRM|nr:MAG: Uncharacterized protein XD97_0322 [Pelotomaculum thermopropionicum]
MLVLEKLACINMLYDFYGRLLTERQKMFVELYYCQNLSLGEIADEFKVTRQAVYDTLKRAEQLLTGYEEKLGLALKFCLEKDKLSSAAALLDEGLKDSENKSIRKARDILQELLHDREYE